MLDTAQENLLQGTDFADPNYTAYKKQMGTVFLDFKELNNMGASFTESEQQMMRNAMPNLDSSDAEYKRDMVEFTKVIRDKVKSKIMALDSANYNTGELKKVTDYYDGLVKKAEAKFGAEQQQSNNDSSTNAPTEDEFK
jgi:predicted ribonuclease YlaK